MSKVTIGSQVSVKFDDGEEDTFLLVGSGEADLTLHKISSVTPFGKAVLGKAEGAKVQYLNNFLRPIHCQILRVN